jgi:hypothetical protein
LPNLESETCEVICPICGENASLGEREGKLYYVCPKSDWQVSKYNVDVEQEIVDLLRNVKVAYRNEIRYRLEKRFPFHSMTEYAIRRLAAGKAYTRGLAVKTTNLPGRRSSSASNPNVFYKLTDEKSNSHLNDIMREKLALSTFVTEISREAGFHAQALWRDAFKSLGYEIIKENASENAGRKASIEGNIDFIAEKAGLQFGVEVKNELSYPDDLAKKFQIAAELGTIPVFVVRKVSPTAYQNLKKFGALVKIYETAIFNLEYEPMVKRCISVLGYPLIALDEVSSKTVKHLEDKVLGFGHQNAGALAERNFDFLNKMLGYGRMLKVLDRELKFA